MRNGHELLAPGDRQFVVTPLLRSHGCRHADKRPTGVVHWSMSPESPLSEIGHSAGAHAWPSSWADVTVLGHPGVQDLSRGARKGRPRYARASTTFPPPGSQATVVALRAHRAVRGSQPSAALFWSLVLGIPGHHAPPPRVVLPPLHMAGRPSR